jgi:hypothetical protein
MSIERMTQCRVVRQSYPVDVDRPYRRGAALRERCAADRAFCDWLAEFGTWLQEQEPSWMDDESMATPFVGVYMTRRDRIRHATFHVHE